MKPEQNPWDHPTMQRLHVSVIIPHYDQPAALKECLESLAMQTMAADAFEIIVIDNASGLDLDAFGAAHPGVQFLCEPERGAACARNRGLKSAKGDVIAFIDADCIADPEWLEAGCAALATSDLVGGDIRVTIGDRHPSPVEAFERIFAFRQRLYIRRKHFAATANLFAKRHVVDAVGSFKNGVSEDVEWCHRARALGFCLAFNDTSIISHPARKCWSDLTAKWDRTIRERWSGFGGHRRVRQVWWAILAAATALSALPHLVAVLCSERVSGVRAKAGAAVVLMRIRFWRARRMLVLLSTP